MKTHIEVTSSRRKCRKAHFTAPSHIRYRLMSAMLSKELKSKHNVRSLPVRKDDEVSILKGIYKGTKGKITQVYRKRWCIYIEKLAKSKANGAPFNIPLKPCQCVLTKLKLDKDRQDLIKRKQLAKAGGKGKGDKYQAADVKKKID